MPSSPSTIPLSAQEAKDRLREIVEAFFFRRRSDQGRPPAPQLLVRSPPGLGKTKEAMEWATRYQTEQQGKDSILELSRSDITLAGVWAQVAIFVPRHELAQEVKEVIQRNREDLGEPVVVPVLRGRDHEADKDNAPCRRWREARELGRKGLPVYSNLCRRRHQQDVSECPYFADCEYIPAWQSAHAAPYVIPVHAHLGVGWESSRTVRGAVGLSDSDDEEEPQFDQSFNPANAAIVVCDEDPTSAAGSEGRTLGPSPRAGSANTYWRACRLWAAYWTISARRGSRQSSFGILPTSSPLRKEGEDRSLNRVRPMQWWAMRLSWHPRWSGSPVYWSAGVTERRRGGAGYLSSDLFPIAVRHCCCSAGS